MNSDPSLLPIFRRRHPEWIEHQLRWQWLLDSFEGGERYRQAIYGVDRRGLPIRNLIRHKREYPDPREAAGPFLGILTGEDPAAVATDDDYELRRARTPIPTFVAEAIETHLSRIYAREVVRVGPDKLMVWWSNVDGKGTSIDQWMAETVAPLLLALGQIDLRFDHPPVTDSAEIDTLADVQRLGLDRAISCVILPQDMVWWRLDTISSRYEECLVREWVETQGGLLAYYRYWDSHESVLYDSDGKVLSNTPHPFGRVPIVRVFDGKKARCKNIGQSRYEGVAERQREYYNRDSELILSDTTQAHPLLQGPEDFIQSDGTVPIGPSWLLPKKKNSQGGTVTYEGFDIVQFPKDGAESIRKNKADLRDDVDRECALVRPTGHSGTIQSGLAKLIDHTDGNNRLAKLAKVLGRVEQIVAAIAMTVLEDGSPDPDDLINIDINYPAEFDLYTATDVAAANAEFQKLVSNAGLLPLTEGLMLSRLVRLCLPGLSDAQYAECDIELANYLANRQEAFVSQNRP